MDIKKVIKNAFIIQLSFFIFKTPFKVCCMEYYKLILRLWSSWISLIFLLWLPTWRFLFKNINQMFPIMITRSPLSPHFNPYSKYILEVFPGISVYCYSLLQFVFQLLSQQITHDICFCIIRCSKRNLDICHYILSLNLKLYICPNLGERSKIYKVSYDTINGFLAPSSSSLYD